jgi:hypothetical protein
MDMLDFSNSKLRERENRTRYCRSLQAQKGLGEPQQASELSLDSMKAVYEEGWQHTSWTGEVHM